MMMKQNLSRDVQRAAVTVAALLFVAAMRGPGAQEAASLRAGAAAVDITPTQFPVNMPGGFGENLAAAAHDPLHARALVLADGRETLALVLVDNVGVHQETIDEAKALAARRCPLRPERMLVSSTHSHSAPPSNVKEGDPAAVAYRKLLVEGIADAIVRAHGALRPAAVGHAVQPLAEEVFNRRWFLKPGRMPLNPFGKLDRVKMNPGTDPVNLDRPAGPTDPDITLLSVQDARTRKPLALYANYSLHYVGGIPPARVSADYYGEFARLAPSRIGGGPDTVAMMTNGTSGDINNIPFRVGRAPREPFEQVRIVAQKAADTVWRGWSGIGAHQADVRLGMLQRQVTLRMRRPTEAEVTRAKQIVALTDPAEKAKLPALADVYARRMLALAEGPRTLSAPVQAIRIGDLAICTFPFETFAETGLELKRLSPFPRTMVVSLANGAHGYLPTPPQHQLGGYETWLGTNRVEENASVILSRNLLEMLGELARE